MRGLLMATLVLGLANGAMAQTAALKVGDNAPNFKLQATDGKTYALTPLKYTPKYSVITEVDPSKLFLTQVDRVPGQVGGNVDPTRASQYEAFRRSLPKETNKPVKGDIP